jgi:hypothetical protein
MKKSIEVKVPNNWSAVTLRQYLALKKDMDAYKDEPEALMACMFHHLCGFPVEFLANLDIETYSKIGKQLGAFMSEVELPLQRFIKIGGVEYGFEPNLSKMTYGAYVDIAKYDTMTMDNNWADIMSILYRPVVNKIGQLYDIQTYDANIDGEKFMDVTMDIHFGALFFFVVLSRDLQNSILKSLIQNPKEMSPNTKSILEKSGNLIQVLSNLPKETSSK